MSPRVGLLILCRDLGVFVGRDELSSDEEASPAARIAYASKGPWLIQKRTP